MWWNVIWFLIGCAAGAVGLAMYSGKATAALRAELATLKAKL